MTDDEPVRGDTGEHDWQNNGRGGYSCACGKWSETSRGPDLDRYDSMAYRAWERHVKESRSPVITHFAPYGSTNATCDETVPQAAGWDVTRGEYLDPRFTTRRDKVTCEQCRWQIRVFLPDLTTPRGRLDILLREEVPWSLEARTMALQTIRGLIEDLDRERGARRVPLCREPGCQAQLILGNHPAH